ncbi:hypothetical protein ACFX1R_020423 [Malus domestica]
MLTPLTFSGHFLKSLPQVPDLLSDLHQIQISSARRATHEPPDLLRSQSPQLTARPEPSPRICNQSFEKEKLAPQISDDVPTSGRARRRSTTLLLSRHLLKVYIFNGQWILLFNFLNLSQVGCCCLRARFSLFVV